MNRRASIRIVRWLALAAGLALAFAACETDTEPDPPPSVAATAGNGEVVIRWGLAEDADSYNIYWDTAPGVTTGRGSERIPNVTSPHTHTGLTNGVTYYYIVTAENDEGESDPSREVSATPLPPMPGTPGAVSATAGNRRVVINWKAVSGATGYNLYWKTTSEVTKSSGTRIGGVSRPYTHTRRTNGTTYHYVVTARNLAGESGGSLKVFATPLGFDTLVQAPFAASDTPQAGERFGGQIAVEGGRALIGAPLTDVGPDADVGAGYVLARDPADGTWGVTDTLTASDGAANDRFGRGVAMDGDTLLIGADGANLDAGAAYVFDRDPVAGTWGETQKLSASDGASNDAFGAAVALDGDTALIGAPPAGAGAGAVYVFERDAVSGVWSEAQKLDGAPLGAKAFGASIALEGELAVIGAPLSDAGLELGAGAVYVFERDTVSGVWNGIDPALAPPSVALAGDQLGRSVALSGDTIAVGARFADSDPATDPLSNEGAVYLFKADAGSGEWTQAAKLVADAPRASDLFGARLALDGNELLVGAPLADLDSVTDPNTDEGAAFAFYRSSVTGSWRLTPVRIVPAGLAAGDNFGPSLALSRGTGLIGAPFADPLDTGATPVTDAGLLYIYE
jgi:hypothetical protein